MSVTDSGDMIPLNVVLREFSEKFDFIPCDIFIALLGKQPGMNGTGGKGPVGSDHFFSNLKPLFMVE